MNESDAWEESPQDELFAELKNDWRREWKGMPEYVNNNLTPMKSIIIHFADECDLKDFAEKLGLKIYMTTKSSWYPAAEIGSITDKRYVDEK